MRRTCLKLTVVCTLLVFIFCTFVTLWMLNNVYDRENQPRSLRTEADHLLCVLIPYRDRLSELKRIVPHLGNFLANQHIKYRIIVLNQTDLYRFNRASLINVGYIEATRLGCDYICMHDVDLLPMNPNLNYRYPGIGIIRHISAGRYHPIKRYDYSKFIGGILMLTVDDFRKVDGMSNKYWGWGLEDDEFYMRLKDANLTDAIQRPENLTTDRSSTFEHIHDKSRKRDYLMIGDQKKISRRRDRVSGLHSLQYTIESRSLLKYNTTDAFVLNVALVCDYSWTPYCKISQQKIREK